MLLELPLSVCRVAALLQKHHYQVYLVGGSIRDLLLGTKTKDYDLTTDASPQQILTVLASWPTGLAGLPYGTVLVKDQDYPLEITSMRQDSGYRDHRHPEQVVFTSSIVADLARRDFTINAMA